jgi:cell division protein FtsL
MSNVTRIVHKVQQAPWRIQRQWLGLFLLGLIVVAMLAGLYLSVTTRTALAGRELQMLQNEITENRRINADLEIQRASLCSSATMRERALAMGFRPARPDEVTYVFVRGYQPPAAVDLSHNRPAAPETLLLPAYRQSLLEWFSEQLAAPIQTAGR